MSPPVNAPRRLRRRGRCCGENTSRRRSPPSSPGHQPRRREIARWVQLPHPYQSASISGDSRPRKPVPRMREPQRNPITGGHEMTVCTCGDHTGLGYGAGSGCEERGAGCGRGGAGCGVAGVRVRGAVRVGCEAGCGGGGGVGVRGAGCGVRVGVRGEGARCEVRGARVRGAWVVGAWGGGGGRASVIARRAGVTSALLNVNLSARYMSLGQHGCTSCSSSERVPNRSAAISARALEKPRHRHCGRFVTAFGRLLGQPASRGRSWQSEVGETVGRRQGRLLVQLQRCSWRRAGRPCRRRDFVAAGSSTTS